MKYLLGINVLSNHRNIRNQIWNLTLEYWYAYWKKNDNIEQRFSKNLLGWQSWSHDDGHYVMLVPHFAFIWLVLIIYKISMMIYLLEQCTKWSSYIFCKCFCFFLLIWKMDFNFV